MAFIGSETKLFNSKISTTLCMVSYLSGFYLVNTFYLIEVDTKIKSPDYYLCLNVCLIWKGIIFFMSIWFGTDN